MGAARYIGRVGGLAVALGVGAAVFTGYGVASADSDSDGPSPTTVESPDADAGASSGSGVLRRPGILPRRGLGLLPRAGRPADDTTATPDDDGAADTTPRSRSARPARAGVSSFADRVAEVLDKPAPGSSFAAGQAVADTPSALTWLQTPRVAAARHAPVVSVLSRLPRTPLATNRLTQAALTVLPGAEPTAPTTRPARPALLSAVVNQVVNPFAGGGPTAPTAEPFSWVMAAAARRDFAVLATQEITYAPVLTLQDAVITGTNPDPTVSERGYPLRYTVVSEPSGGGKVLLDKTTGSFASFLPYKTATWGTEQFSVLVAETPPWIGTLEGIPLVGLFVQPILDRVYQLPILPNLLGPIIGYSSIVDVTVNVPAILTAAGLDPLNPNTPIAFTIDVTSFDGTLISTNFFPKSGQLTTDLPVETILNGPGLAAPGNTNPDSVILGGVIPGLKTLRQNYNVITWDPRGEFASGGKLELDSPFFEARDVSAIIDWAAGQPHVKLQAPGDPYLGMAGGSYGGGIQWNTAGTDNRIEAIVPAISWNSLNDALYPNKAVKTSWGLILTLGLVTTGARIDNQIYTALATGLFGFLTQSQQAYLASKGPTSLVKTIKAPAMIIQGSVDTLFPLDQSILNAQELLQNPDLVVPPKLFWFCGGHGVCLDPVDTDVQDAKILEANLKWLDQYVRGVLPADPIPTFEWVDQTGTFFSSTLLPFQAGFIDGDIDTVDGDGGFLGIAPFLGGSGPQRGPNNEIPLIAALAFAAPARNAVEVPLTAPTSGVEYIVGAPELSFTYSGLGTSRTVYAQIVDEDTGRVVGNIVSPIPVTLDGRTHTVNLEKMEAIAYTMTPSSKLTLQITSSATTFENLTAYGWIRVSDVDVSLPTANPMYVAPS